MLASELSKHKVLQNLSIEQKKNHQINYCERLTVSNSKQKSLVDNFNKALKYLNSEKLFI
jgi:hypothetical protein